MVATRRVVPPPRGWPRLRRLAERLLHPLFRWRAHAVLRRRSQLRALLVVCHGNICRSPFGAALLARHLASAGVRVKSAGFVGPDRSCPENALVAAARWGADLSEHRSTLLMPDVVRSADLIVVMDPAQRRAISERFGRSPRTMVVLGDLDPAPLQVRAIRDPVEQDTDAFLDSYSRIERCVADLVRTRAREVGRADTLVEQVC